MDFNTWHNAVQTYFTANVPFRTMHLMTTPRPASSGVIEDISCMVGEGAVTKNISDCYCLVNG